MMKAARVRPADIHIRPLADRLQPLENLELVALIALHVCRCHKPFSLSAPLWEQKPAPTATGRPQRLHDGRLEPALKRGSYGRDRREYAGLKGTVTGKERQFHALRGMLV